MQLFPKSEELGMWFEWGQKKTSDQKESKCDWNKEGIYFNIELIGNIWNRKIPLRDRTSLSVWLFDALSLSNYK